MRYAPRRPPPPQARTLIRGTLRAAARVAAPGPAWPGSAPWRPGSPGGVRPPPREKPGNQLPKPRHPDPALTRGGPRLRRPPNPHRAVIRGRPERRPRRAVIRGRPERRPRRAASQGRPAPRPRRAVIRGRPQRRPPRTASQGRPAPRPPGQPSRPSGNPLRDRSAWRQARGPWGHARNLLRSRSVGWPANRCHRPASVTRGWPGYQEPRQRCPGQARSTGPGRPNHRRRRYHPQRPDRTAPGRGHGRRGSPPARAAPTGPGPAA